MRKASMSSPESVSSRMANLGSRTAIWKISLRFFSPPEKPSLSERFKSESFIFTSLAFSRTMRRNCAASSGASPRYLRISLTAVFKKLMVVTPGISTGYWKARKMPSAARSSGARSSKSLPSKSTLPLVISYSSRPANTEARVLLPEPLGPMMAWTSPGFTVKSIPRNISLPSMEAYKSLMVSI